MAMPFSVITCLNAVPVRNLGDDNGPAHWKELYTYSKAWQKRAPALRRALDSAQGSVNGQQWGVSDIDPHGVNFLIVDRTKDETQKTSMVAGSKQPEVTTNWDGESNHHFHHLVEAIGRSCTSHQHYHRESAQPSPAPARSPPRSPPRSPFHPHTATSPKTWACPRSASRRGRATLWASTSATSRRYSPRSMRCSAANRCCCSTANPGPRPPSQRS